MSKLMQVTFRTSLKPQFGIDRSKFKVDIPKLRAALEALPVGTQEELDILYIGEPVRGVSYTFPIQGLGQIIGVAKMKLTPEEQIELKTKKDFGYGFQVVATTNKRAKPLIFSLANHVQFPLKDDGGTISGCQLIFPNGQALTLP